MKQLVWMVLTTLLVSYVGLNSTPSAAAAIVVVILHASG